MAKAAEKNTPNEIRETESEIMRLVGKLAELHRQEQPQPIRNYVFQDLRGDVTLEELFAGKDILFAIHNMGQGCRYCTLWADGMNGFLPHLEDRFAVVMLSKDMPDVQRRLANSRGWRYRMASHGGGAYMQEQSVSSEGGNAPGMVCYIRKDGQIFRKGSAQFGPNDIYCALWPIIGLAGLGTDDWVAQYSYWKRPAQLDDGGKDVR